LAPATSPPARASGGHPTPRGSPTQKSAPAPPTTTTRTRSSCSARSQASVSAPSSSWSRVLRPSVSQAMPSSTTAVTGGALGGGPRRIRSPGLDPGAQLASQHLAHRVLRQLRQEADDLGLLEARQPLAAELAQVVGGGGRARPQHHERADALSPLDVRQSDHR